MNAMVLKLIALATMFVDHLFASNINPGWIDLTGTAGQRFLTTNWNIYYIGRIIGRIAFPIFCFQIAEGVKYTKNWRKYALRLAGLAILSEWPFDFALKHFAVNWDSQNVYFTLLLGMAIVTFMRVVKEDWKYLVWPVLVYGMALIAQNVLKSDYGWSGVVCIAVMGLMNEPWERLFQIWTPQLEQMKRVIFAALGILILYYKNNFEIYALLALIPIALYNGRKGYTKRLQIAFYLFYPVHLLLLGVVAWCFGRTGI